MMKRSTKRPSSPRSRKTRQSLAPLRRRAGSTAWMACRKASRCSGIDPVFDLDQHRSVVGQRLDGDREIRQLHARRHVRLVAHLDADAAVEREQHDHQAGRCGERDAACRTSDASAAPDRAAQRQARLHGDEVHRHGARAHPRRRRALGPGRQAGEDADPRRPGAATRRRARARRCRSTAMSSVATRPQQDARRDHRVQRRPVQLRGNRQRADDRADAEAARTACRSRRHRVRAGRARSTGSSAHSALAQTAEAQVADDQRAHRRRVPGVAQAALDAGEQRLRNARDGRARGSSSRAPRRSSTTKNSALASIALPEPSHAAIAPASAGPTARATLNATAPSATARDSSARGDEVVDARLLRRQVEREARRRSET